MTDTIPGLKLIENEMKRKELLFNQSMFLSKEDRKELAFRMLETVSGEKMDLQDRYEMLVSKAEVATEHELDRSKSRESTMIRRFVATRLKDEGYGWSDIGRIMGRSHSAIFMLVHSMYDVLSVPCMYEKDIMQYNSFLELVEEFDNG